MAVRQCIKSILKTLSTTAIHYKRFCSFFNLTIHSYLSIYVCFHIYAHSANSAIIRVFVWSHWPCLSCIAGVEQLLLAPECPEWGPEPETDSNGARLTRLRHIICTESWPQPEPGPHHSRRGFLEVPNYNFILLHLHDQANSVIPVCH